MAGELARPTGAAGLAPEVRSLCRMFIEWRSAFDYVDDGNPSETVSFLETAVYRTASAG